MLMPAGAVYMAMAQFFGGCFAHVGDLHIEVQTNARQRVVAIDQHLALGHLFHGYHVVFTGLELHADFDLLATELIEPYTLEELRVHRTVAVFGRNSCFELIALHMAGHLTLKAWNDHTNALDIGESIHAIAAVEHLAVIIGKGVVEAHYAIVLDLHTRTGRGIFGSSGSAR